MITDVLRWERPGPLAPGATLQVWFRVRVDPNTPSKFTIRNTTAEYEVRSAEILLDPLQGKNNVNVKVESTLEKIVETKRNAGSTRLAYPGDVVTYTLTVNNPLTTTLSGVRITDTLPGNPQPLTFLGAAYNTQAPDEILNGGRDLIWEGEISGHGILTRSFSAKIPLQIQFPANKDNIIIYNGLQASHADVSFSTEPSLAPIKVEAPLVMSKVSNVNHGLNGDTVVYTITLNNRGPFTVTNIRLTDTLEGDFHFITMTLGPTPVPTYTYNPVVWEGITLTPGTQYQIAFAAEIGGNWLETYRNNLNASSPDVSIPPRTGLAGVKVDSPLRINKTVDPTEVFVGQNIIYAITLTNVSNESWTLAEVQDHLPDGFYQVGGGNDGGTPAIIPITTPVTIAPGSLWAGDFVAHVSNQVSCENLPKNYPNERGAIAQHFIAPHDIWVVNASNMAPVTVMPNVKVDLIPYRRTVQPGSMVSMTLHLENVSPLAVTSSTLQITLPDGVSFLSHVSGITPTVSGQTLTWADYNLPSQDSDEMVFWVQLAPDIETGTLLLTFSGTASDVCFGKLDSGALQYGDGKIIVADQVVILTKRALLDRVAPLSLVDYEIKLQNKDVYPFVLPVVTDTLPTGFTYMNMVSGPTPDLIVGRNLYWYNVEILGSKSVTWKVQLQASSLYGISEPNTIAANSPEIEIDPAQSGPVTILPLFDLNKTASVSETVPGGLISYTISLVNQSELNYANIRLTDTLPSGFTYESMDFGTPPDSGTITEPVWSGLSVSGNCSPTNQDPCMLLLTLNVRVASSVPPGVYLNGLMARSPSGSIPGPLNAAPVTVTLSTITPTPTFTPTPTHSATPTPSPTASRTPTFTPSNTPTFTPSNTPTVTLTPSETPTPQASQGTPTQSPPTITLTPSDTPAITASPTWTIHPTITASFTPSPTGSATATPTEWFSPTPSQTPTPTQTLHPTITASFTPSPTVTTTPKPPQYRIFLPLLSR